MKTKKFIATALLAVALMAIGTATASAATPLDTVLAPLTKPDASNPTIIVSQILGVPPYWIPVTLPDGTVIYIDPPRAVVRG